MRSVTRTTVAILVVVSALDAQAALGSPLLVEFSGEITSVNGD